jgi:tRNA (mo5U34)-methyltransferase
MVFQTLTMPGDGAAEDTHDRPIEEREQFLRPDWPKMAFIEHRFAGDPTNWWLANHACVEAMLRSSGMRITDRPGHEMYLCVPDDRPVVGEEAVLADMRTAELMAATGRPWKQQPAER